MMHDFTTKDEVKYSGIQLDNTHCQLGRSISFQKHHKSWKTSKLHSLLDYLVTTEPEQQ